MSDTISLVMDVKSGRPACVLLQAVYGCETWPVSSYFDARTWLVSPTEGMRIVKGTREQVKQHAARINAATRPKP